MFGCWWSYLTGHSSKCGCTQHRKSLHKLPSTTICSLLRFLARGGVVATNRKATGSLPDGITGIFHWHKPSGHTAALGSTQPVTEMSTRNISWGGGGGKDGRCIGLTTLPPSCADCLEVWEPQPPGTPSGLSRPVMGLLTKVPCSLFIKSD
jgi:hypothetical protein